MDILQFWNVIDQARLESGRLCDLPSSAKALLITFDTLEIIHFERWLRKAFKDAYDAKLWAAACVVFGICSDDKFYDFQSWLIANGQRIFDLVLLDPDRLADIDLNTGDDQKPLLFKFARVAQDAYREKTGGNDITDMLPISPWPPLRNEGVWDGDRNKLPKMFPRLFAKYGLR
jgi:hypothetical protein